MSSLHELFACFNCTNNTGSLVENSFGVKILIPVPVSFSGINFTLSAMVCSSSDFKYWSSISLSDILRLEYLVSSLYFLKFLQLVCFFLNIFLASYLSLNFLVRLRIIS